MHQKLQIHKKILYRYCAQQFHRVSKSCSFNFFATKQVTRNHAQCITASALFHGYYSKNLFIIISIYYSTLFGSLCVDWRQRNNLGLGRVLILLLLFVFLGLLGFLESKIHWDILYNLRGIQLYDWLIAVGMYEYIPQLIALPIRGKQVDISVSHFLGLGFDSAFFRVR